jgi:hypothetical protein
MRRFLIGLVAFIILVPSAVLAVPVNSNYKWVKDEKVSSQSVLNSTQAIRVVPLETVKALELVREVMNDNLHLSITAYDQARQQQVAETTSKTILPGKIAREETPIMASADYVFILEIKLKSDGNNKTRIMLVANPVYRVDTVQNTKPTQSSIEVTIKSDSTQAVNLGPVFMMPTAGQPADFDLQTLPDAAERAALLVRSFLFYLDQKMTERAKS